jgi:hypothetical protein
MRGLICVIAILAMASFAVAGEPAATTELPQALTAIGAQQAVVTATEAHQVRGMCFTLTQHKDFSINHGVATGSTTLLEGVFGTFEFVDFQNGGEGGTSITVEGTFGGLTGSIGATDMGLEFSVLGKALQESIDFAGKFSQDFSQSITIPLP